MKVYRCAVLLDNIQYTIEAYASSIEEAISYIKNKYPNMEVEILNIEELFYF